jgi:aryl-alcohol dehydrogenase-like predicted oxidoreductase
MALTDEMFNQLEQIKAEAQKQGCTLLQHALKSLLETPSIYSLVVGVKTIPQLDRLVLAIGKKAM